MFILINVAEMEFVAKHPNFATLYELGVIGCPDDSAVFPLEMDSLLEYQDAEIELLYISLTLEAPRFSGNKLRRIVLGYLNEIAETRLDASSVSSQASYCIKWGIEGHCSYLPGKKEPSMDEGKFNPSTIICNVEWENALTFETPIVFKTPAQAPFTRSRES